MNTATLDLPTINAATRAVVEAIQSAVCQWEQQSQDAAHDGNLSSALMYQNWAFAADLMAKTATTKLTNLLVDAYDQQNPQVTISITESALLPRQNEGVSARSLKTFHSPYSNNQI
jgi:hypothetical protein